MYVKVLMCLSSCWITLPLSEGEGSPKCSSRSLAREFSWTSLKHWISFFHEWSSSSCIHCLYIISTVLTRSLCSIALTIAPVSSFSNKVPISVYFAALSFNILIFLLDVDSFIRSGSPRIEHKYTSSKFLPCHWWVGASTPSRCKWPIFYLSSDATHTVMFSKQPPAPMQYYVTRVR